MDKPVVVQKSPYVVEVEQGKTYAWCACGHSATQPFCDGSHSGTGFEPVIYKADATAKVSFCGCKTSGNKPFCDGSHNSL